VIGVARARTTVRLVPELPPEDLLEEDIVITSRRRLEPGEPMQLPWAFPEALKRKIEELRGEETT
jgi:hypothetical protein